MIGRTNVGGGSSAPSYSIHGWCATVGLSYAVLDDIPEADMRTLMTKYASVAYFMEWYSNEPDMIDDFIANAYAMKWIGLRDYICDQLMALQSVRTKMLASANWGYILKDHVPTMTSDTAPYGECRAISSYTTYLPYKAFDKSTSTVWLSNQDGVKHATNIWIEYKFSNPICARKFYIRFESSVSTMQYKIQGSNDGTNYVDITETRNTVTNGYQDMTNDTYYMIYRLFIIDETTTSSPPGRIIELDFYGRSLNVSVPKMTGNTAPYGEIKASGDYDSARARLKAFDGTPSSPSSWGWLPASSDTWGSAWIGYKFTKDVTFKAVSLFLSEGRTETPQVRNMQFKIVGITSGGVSEDISDTLLMVNSATTYLFYVNSNKLYREIRFVLVGTTEGSLSSPTTGSGWKINFFGVDYSERADRTYLYDHGVEVVPISIFNQGGTAGTVEKSSNQIIVDPTGSNTLCVYNSSPIIFTSQLLTRVNLGDQNIASTYGFGWLRVYDSITQSSLGNRIADKDIPVSETPNNVNLDIANVVGSYYLAIGGGVPAVKISITEWWLE